ncbi:unnamed protein product [Lymnaea stagnalis]|uniref:Uncharacterized protein n=1 Tax=Lymnaea stagnalis TaxID=6523 RepID=A0AAV2HD60_LYMST
MARPAERMRLKDKIIDNISKAIKSIQELLFYQANDPVLGSGASELGVTLGNGDRPCHKLCENLDHAMLHGLKEVTHGYWRVVKQLSHKGMIRDIEILVNVTTDLGRGRAWLYASLNEGLLESYIKLLGDNDKLLKKYYAKDALLLDGDRMNQLLTLTSGLDCVTFALNYDLPYLDLNAYPPRSRTDTEMEGDVYTGSPASRINSISFLRTDSMRSASDFAPSSPDFRNGLRSDSDCASMTSLDAHSQTDQAFHMRASTYSEDSGYPNDGIVSSSTRQRSITPTDVYVHSKPRSGTPSDTLSMTSLGSVGDPDRHQRLESIVPAGDEDRESESLEVIRIPKPKDRSTKQKKKKHASSKKRAAEKVSSSQSQGEAKSGDSATSHLSSNQTESSKVVGKEHNGSQNADKTMKYAQSYVTESQGPQSVADSEHPDGGKEITVASFPQFDSGVDICGLTEETEPKTPTDVRRARENGDVNSSGAPTEDSSSHTRDETSRLSWQQTKGHMSSLAKIEGKIAELCHVEKGHEASTQIRTAHLNDRNVQVTKDKHLVGSKVEVIGVNPDSGQKSSPDLPRHRDDNMSVQSTSKTSGVSTLNKSNTSLVNSEDKNKAVTSYKQVNKSCPEAEHNPRNSVWSVQNDERVSDVAGGQSAQERDDELDFYSNPGSNKENVDSRDQTQTRSESSEVAANAQAASQLKDYVAYILQSSDSSPGMTVSDKINKYEEQVDLAVDLDNNTKLQIMLDIMTHEDEKFIQMYASRENQVEGDSSVVYILISDQCLYLLKYREASRKFVLHSSAMLVDLIFISTGLNDQTMNIESRGKNKQKQRLFITPGHQALTKAILTCLTEAVRKANENFTSVRSRFSVGSEVPLQKIALRKYISKELHCETTDVSINDYSLVFWEDPSSSPSHQADGSHKAGKLLLRTQDPIKGFVWKPVYVVIKNSMLTVSNNKSDPRPHSYLGLGGDQCVGCRHISLQDRNNCVELVTANGGSWFLSAASETEIMEWGHALCLAVSQGMEDSSSLRTCVPCCSVLSCSRLFMCHEDLQTKFFRTLGRAQVEDITSLRLSAEDSTYCVIEFESQEPGVSSVQWVFYFTSPQDLDRFKAALTAVWGETFQVELPILPLDDLSLQWTCHSHSQQLQQQLSFR